MTGATETLIDGNIGQFTCYARQEIIIALDPTIRGRAAN